VHYGLTTAARVVLVAGADSVGEAAMADAELIYVANTIEMYMCSKGIDPFGMGSFVVYEIQVAQNAKLLLPVVKSDAVVPLHGGAESSRSAPSYSWRAVNGSLIATNNLASLFAWAYYSPGIMDVFLTMVCASEEDPVMPWRAQLPPSFEGRQYGEVVAMMVEGVPCHAGGSIKALTLGLLRAPHTSALGFTFTNPPPCTVITAGDAVCVLSTPAFAETLDSAGFLKLLCVWASASGGEPGSFVPTMGSPEPETDPEGQPGLRSSSGSNSAEPVSPLGKEELGISRSFLNKLIMKMFMRYDLNDTGTVDTLDELKNLTMSVLFALLSEGHLPKAHMSPEEVRRLCAILAGQVAEPFEWSAAEYVEWFEDKLKALTAQLTSGEASAVV